MGIYSEQLEQRRKSDDDAFLDSIENIAAAVEGNADHSSQNAIDTILKYFHVKSSDIPENMSDVNEQLEFVLRPKGIMYRRIKLSEGWYKNAIGAMLGIKKEDGKVVALLPTGLIGYSYYDESTHGFVKINKDNSQLIEENGYVFYKPFPLKKMTLGSLIRYILNTISLSDYILIALATLAAMLIGLLSPMITKIALSKVVDNESVKMLIALLIFSICVTVSTLFINMIKNIIGARLTTKLRVFMHSATMMRLLFLPASFFKKYSSGDLFSRINAVNNLCSALITTFLFTGLTSIFAFLYIIQIVNYAPALALPALLVSLTTIMAVIMLTVSQTKITREKQKYEGIESGISYALISGIQKIKLSGAEKRAFAQFGNSFARRAQVTYNPPLFLKIGAAIPVAISLTGMLVIYYAATKSGVAVSDYYAFNTAYGIMTGALTALTDISSDVAEIKPTLERIEPLLNTPPEISEGKKVVRELSGDIEINNIYFRYNESTPYVLDDLSLKIKSGQYVAVVGNSGCGKSTLIRLLLGLESPEKGAIYYDGKDISTLDLKSLRRKIGSVTQDGKLFQGDIYSNIVISAPWLTVKEAWEAAELAGISDDIRRMPMGMNTLISEGAGGISGGQRQRLMIARAIAPKPKVLIFDEATSALDNITQKKVSEALDSLNCTRIVVAHRLSTITHCDRIIVLDKGKIVEDGTYDELLAKEGIFAELVSRQQLTIS